MNCCAGCGVPTSADTPVPERCGLCPPWICDGCGKTCSAKSLCACWTALDGMNLADLKGVFASIDLSLTQ
ncbi:hypothetical protein B5566_02505 [Mycobacterium sp. MHSD3]|nr:hypothetical protein B5566_02505 [Mycobacterium sp. MHSD3]